MAAVSPVIAPSPSRVWASRCGAAGSPARTQNTMTMNMTDRLKLMRMRLVIVGEYYIRRALNELGFKPEQRYRMSTTTQTIPTRSRRHSAAWWTVVVLSWIIVGYGAMYLVLRERIFPPDLADSFKARPWGIYPHVIVGMIGLAIGPLQFHPRVQANTKLHRTLGTVYVCIGMLVGIVGMYMAAYSFGGMVTHFGFGLLGLGTLVTTIVAYRKVLSQKYAEHREWMI